MKEIDKIIEKIINLPFDFSKKNKSIYCLLQESGYFSLYDQINDDQILEILRRQPQSIEYWLTWSGNKRSDAGWYFTKNENGQYFVGYYPEENNFKEISLFDKFKACALFIKREIESIRTT